MGKNSKLQLIAKQKRQFDRSGDQNSFYKAEGLEIVSFWTPRMRNKR
jgi:hypothetical protein